MSRRTWLVGLSISAHFAIGIGLFATGVWDLERLESDRRLAGIGIMTPTGGGGGSPELPAAKFEKKQPQAKKIVKDPVQPAKRTEREEPAETTTATETGDGETGTGTGTGPGDGPNVGPGDRTGTCALPPCDRMAPLPPPAPEPPKPPPAPRAVAPNVMSALRVAGDTQIHPSRQIQHQMIDDRQRRSVGMVKVCISATGAISSVSLLRSTRYSEYDAQLVAAVRGWRYRPYTVDGVAVPACSAVSFVYTIN